MKTFLFFVMFMVVPVSVFAQIVPAPEAVNLSEETGIFDENFQLVPCGGTDNPFTFEKEDVECDYNILVNTFNKLLKYFIYLAHFFAIAMFMYAGFLYMFAADNPSNKERAKSIFKNIGIGLFFVYAGWLLVYSLLTYLIDPAFVDEAKKNNTGVQTVEDIIQLKK
jgi:hypothetical protein